MVAITIVRKSLSTESFDKRLGNRQRFMQFSELFEHFSNTGEFDPAEDAPFKASMNSIAVGTTLLGRCRGTFRTVGREKRQVLATNDDRYCFARNAEAHDAYVVHRGKKFRLRPGSMAILKLDGTFSGADGTSYKRFTNVHLPSGALQAMVANVDDMVGVEFAPSGALTLAMDYSDLVLANDRVADEAGTQIASHILDLVAIGLGARRDAGEMAGKCGLRAVRLTHVLNILQRRFTEAEGHRSAGAAGPSPHQRHRLRLRLQRPVLFQPLLPPPLRADSHRGAGASAMTQAAALAIQVLRRHAAGVLTIQHPLRIFDRQRARLVECRQLVC